MRATLPDEFGHRPMPERDTKLFEVLIGQVAKDGGVNVALGKALRVLGQAERFEPVRNLLHRGHQADFSLPALLDRQHTEFILPAARLKGAFWRA
jgi:hypothetical protein